MLKAPWTPEQVEKLNVQQANRALHPFTCNGRRTDEAHRAYQAEHGGDFGQLVATPVGWICPVCGYTQDWAMIYEGAMVGVFLTSDK
jgi:hypothetical protein